MILLIGGTGKVGGNVVWRLAAVKAKTRVLARSAEKAKEAVSLGLETAEGDVTKIATIEAALHGVDRLFLLTPPSPLQAGYDWKCFFHGLNPRVSLSHPLAREMSI